MPATDTLDALATPDSSIHSRLSLADRIRLLCEHCQECKPTHRLKMTVTHPRTGQPVKFLPGKLLNNLTNRLLSNKGNTLENEFLEMLDELDWFGEWIDRLHSQRSVGKKGGRPSLDEEAILVARHFSVVAPVRGETKLVVRDSGEEYHLNPAAVVERISINWHEESEESYKKRIETWKLEKNTSPLPRRRAATRFSRIKLETKLAIEACDWFGAWYAYARCRREVAKMRKVVSKETKLQLLVDHYGYDVCGNPKLKPVTSDCITVRVDNETFHFYPTNFLDDLIDNWVEGGRPGVVLSSYQRDQLVEKLPWMQPWLNSVFEIRKRRKRRATDTVASLTENKLQRAQWSKRSTVLDADE